MTKKTTKPPLVKDMLVSSASESLTGESLTGESLTVPNAKPKRNNLAHIPPELRSGKRAVADYTDVDKLTIDKHSDKLRYKIAYSAHKLADDLASELTRKGKKDKEYVKGLVWSLGVLFDKLATAGGDAVSVRIPAKLLENVKAVISIQLDKRASKGAQEPIVINPPTVPALDCQSSVPSTESTG